MVVSGISILFVLAVGAILVFLGLGFGIYFIVKLIKAKKTTEEEMRIAMETIEKDIQKPQ